MSAQSRPVLDSDTRRGPTAQPTVVSDRLFSDDGSTDEEVTDDEGPRVDELTPPAMPYDEDTGGGYVRPIPRARSVTPPLRSSQQTADAGRRLDNATQRALREVSPPPGLPEQLTAATAVLIETLVARVADLEAREVQRDAIITSLQQANTELRQQINTHIRDVASLLTAANSAARAELRATSTHAPQPTTTTAARLPPSGFVRNTQRRL